MLSQYWEATVSVECRTTGFRHVLGCVDSHKNVLTAVTCKNVYGDSLFELELAKLCQRKITEENDHFTQCINWVWSQLYVFGAQEAFNQKQTVSSFS